MERSLKHMPVLSKSISMPHLRPFSDLISLAFSPINTEFSQHDVIHFLELVHCKGLHRIPVHQIEPFPRIQAADISV